MGRAILGVILGYVTMAVFVVVVFSAAFIVLGPDGAFREGAYTPSATWIVLSIVLSFVAALLGGIVCARIAPRPGPLRFLVGLVVVLGIVSAVAELAEDREPQVREADVSTFEAASKAEQPLWVSLLNPVIGVAGVLVGGRGALKKPGSAA